VKIERIEICGPFSFAIQTKDRTFLLENFGGEWRRDHLWIAQGRVDRWEALARACKGIEEL